MMHETPQSIANALQRDHGISKGIDYADNVARTARGNQAYEMAQAYTAARDILLSRQTPEQAIDHMNAGGDVYFSRVSEW